MFVIHNDNCGQFLSKAVQMLTRAHIICMGQKGLNATQTSNYLNSIDRSIVL